MKINKKQKKNNTILITEEGKSENKHQEQQGEECKINNPELRIYFLCYPSITAHRWNIKMISAIYGWF